MVEEIFAIKIVVHVGSMLGRIKESHWVILGISDNSREALDMIQLHIMILINLLHQMIIIIWLTQALMTNCWVN